MSIGVFSSITDMLFPMFKNAKEKHKLLTGMPPFAFYKDKNHGLKWKDISSFLDDEILHANRSRIKMQSMKDI